MDIFQSLPSLHAESKTDEATNEPKQVGPRNGPVRYRDITTGQVRRARKRAATKQSRRAYRNQVRTFLSSEREAALIRSSLQAVGVLPYATEGMQPTEDQVLLAVRTLLARYGTGVEATEESLREAIEVALTRYRAITGQGA